METAKQCNIKNIYIKAGKPLFIHYRAIVWVDSLLPSHEAFQYQIVSILRKFLSKMVVKILCLPNNPTLKTLTLFTLLTMASTSKDYTSAICRIQYKH